MKEKKQTVRDSIEEQFPQYQNDEAALNLAVTALEEYGKQGILGYEDIVEHFLRNGRLEYEGFQVKDAHSLALLLQTFRNVNFETFRMVYMKGDTIAAITGVESRLPHFTFTTQERNQSEEVYKIRNRMQRLGADGFYMVHNHPTGEVSPSFDDTITTIRYAGTFPGFRGHIILDHTKYSVLDEQGVLVDTFDIPEEYQNPVSYEIETFLIGTRIKKTGELAAFIDHLNPNPERSVLVLTESTGQIRTFQEIDNQMILHDRNFANYVRNEMRRNGCPNAFLATQNEDVYDLTIPLVAEQYFYDVIYMDEIGIESATEWMQKQNMQKETDIVWAGLKKERIRRQANNSGKMPPLLREEISPYEFEQEEVRSMNMTPKEFLMAEELSVEERDAYGYTYEEMMPLTQNGALQLFDHAPIFLLYEDDTESQANDRTEILEHDGIFGIEAADWVAIKDKIFIAEGNKMQKEDELQKEMRQWFAYADEEAGRENEKLDEEEILRQYLKILREEDKKENPSMQSLTYASDAFSEEVSMRLSTIKGCYWRSYTDGSGSLRRLETDTEILGYNLHPVDSGYDEYEDARGWHGFERSEDFRSALEKLVTEGIVSPMDNGAKDFDLRGNEFEQEEVRSMNMTPEEFLEEMRAYFAGEKEAMATDSLVYTDQETGQMQTLQLSGIKGCYWHQLEDEAARLYRLSTGEEMITCVAGDRQEYRDRYGWHSILPDVDAPGESDDPTFNYISYTIEEMMQSLELDIQAGDVIPMDKTAEEHFIELLKDYDQKNDTKKKPLRYHNEEGITVSMQLAKTMKGCYWKSFDDGSGSLRRLEGNSTILTYDATNSEYQDAAGWHGFDGSRDFRSALEKIVADGIVSPMDNGSTVFDVRNDMSMEELNRILEAHEKWLRGEAGGKQADLSSISLQGADLSGRNLERINLIGADLYGANLAFSNLQGAKLFAADLTNADLTNANLEKAGIANATVKGANFKGANLQNISLLDTIGLEEAQGISQDKLKEEIAVLEDKLEQRELDNFYSDSWEQSAQIRSDIETLQSKLENLTESEKRQSAKRLFVDMDGTLAEFHPVDTMETLYEQGYFAQLAPHENVVNGIKTFMKENPETEVFILTSVLADSPYAQTEKNEWLDRYLPEIGMENRIFAPCGIAKNEFVPGGVRENDALLDDYSKNLHEWPGQALKLMNGINGTKGSFQGEKISAEMSAAEFAGRLASLCEGKEGSLQAETGKIKIHANMEKLDEELVSVEDGTTKNREKREVDTETLTEILEKHESWLRGEEDGERAILDNVILRGADLSGRNLEQITFTEVDLQGANLAFANLRNANLYCVNFENADLSGTNLSKASIDCVWFMKAELRNSNLQNADIYGSYFGYADLSDANLKGVRNWELADFSGANLKGAIADADFKRNNEDNLVEPKHENSKLSQRIQGAVTQKLQTVFQMMNGHLASNPETAVEKRDYGMQDVCKAELLYPVSNTESKVIKLTATQDAAQALSKYNEGDIITFVGIPTNDGYKICRMDDGTVFAKQQKMLYDFTVHGEVPENDGKKELALSDIKEGFKNLSYEEKFKLVLEEELDCHDNEALKEELWETFRDNDSYLGFFGKDEVAELTKRRDKFLEINADTDKDGGMEI